MTSDLVKENAISNGGMFLCSSMLGATDDRGKRWRYRGYKVHLVMEDSIPEDSHGDAVVERR